MCFPFESCENRRNRAGCSERRARHGARSFFVIWVGMAPDGFAHAAAAGCAAGARQPFFQERGVAALFYPGGAWHKRTRSFCREMPAYRYPHAKRRRANIPVQKRGVFSAPKYSQTGGGRAVGGGRAGRLGLPKAGRVALFMQRSGRHRHSAGRRNGIVRGVYEKKCRRTQGSAERSVGARNVSPRERSRLSHLLLCYKNVVPEYALVPLAFVPPVCARLCASYARSALRQNVQHTKGSKMSHEDSAGKTGCKTRQRCRDGKHAEGKCVRRKVPLPGWKRRFGGARAF